MSPRAAWRLESLGFREVYEYPGGKLDWIAAGLPTEGPMARLPRAGDVADPDAPTCRLEDRIGDVRARVRQAGWNVCVVVNEERIVFGLLREEQLEKGEDEPAERVMRPGPSTFRPNVPIQQMAESMSRHGLENSPITTSDGKLVGILKRGDAERVARELEERLRLHHQEHEGHEQAEAQG
jgi:CBS domain-containing protein